MERLGFSTSGVDLRKFPSPFPIASSGYISLGATSTSAETSGKIKSVGLLPLDYCSISQTLLAFTPTVYQIPELQSVKKTCEELASD